MNFQSRLGAALETARKELLSARTPDGHWVGELSGSALSTATAVGALALAEKHAPPFRTAHSLLCISKGLDWLAGHVNGDGGWGDTTLSLSNISTTALCWAAFGAVPGADERFRGIVQGAERWLTQQAGGIEPEKLAPAIIARYGKDRTFSVPILTTCALNGRLGSGASAWKRVLPLPFELAALPQKFFAALRLPVVSYALPALVAIGQARHHHLPSRNPFARLVRNLARARTLKVLASIQPSSGGFLEATPLTSFVVMSLAGSGQVNHPVVQKGVEFLLASAREDGSWPIDTNLATWVSTLSVNALSESSESARAVVLRDEERRVICDWLLKQQYRAVHPYTRAAPGGWAWTNLPGGVPDADDTAGALLALKNLGEIDDRVREASALGVTWLLNLQNSDGGVPTFCRGWTNLPFDRSAPDLTAHALRAWSAWLPDLPADLQFRVRKGIIRAVKYLARAQRPEGFWLPLWFGNQHAVHDENPVYGTAKVLLALADLEGAALSAPDLAGHRRSGALHSVSSMLSRGAEWLCSVQRADGGWGAPGQGPASVEETALAVEALTALEGSASSLPWINGRRQGGALHLHEAAMRGASWLVERVESGEWKQPSPIGFYFAKLWYYERLYPQIFTVAALGRVAYALSTGAD